MMKNYMFPFIFSQNKCFINYIVLECYTHFSETKNMGNGLNPEALKCIKGENFNNFIC